MRSILQLSDIANLERSLQICYIGNMEQKTKERIGMVVGLVLLSMMNGAAGARVLHKMIAKRMREEKRRMMSEESFRSALSRLKKQGMVENEGRGVWGLTKKGMALAFGAENKKKEYERARGSSRSRKDTIVIFDVPEDRKKMRDYLRSELVALGYEQLQKSVWIGGGPLPTAFMEFVRERRLVDTMHVFTIAKKGTVAA